MNIFLIIILAIPICFIYGFLVGFLITGTTNFKEAKPYCLGAGMGCVISAIVLIPINYFILG